MTKFSQHILASFSGRTWDRSLRLLLWCALVIGIAITALRVRQVDLGWQLSEGLSLLHQGRLPQAPPAAFGLPHQPYIDEYSLYEITLAVLDRLGGLHAIWFAFIATYLLVFAVPLRMVREARCDGISLACVALAAIFMINRYEQRPEIVGVLLLVLLLRLLARGNPPTRFSPGFLLRVALLLAIWTNVHSSFLIGLLALFFWLIEHVFLSSDASRWSVRQAAITLGTATAAVLINPYGWHRVAFTFEQERDIGSNILSREMWPAWDQSTLTQGLLLVTAAVLAAAFVSRNRPAPWLIAFSCAMLALSVHGIRHISFLAAALLFVYAGRSPDGARASRHRLTPAVLLGIGCIAALLFDFIALRGAVGALAAQPLRPDRIFAPDLVEDLSRHGPAAVLCHDAEGSYLTLAGGGALRPLLDSGQGHFDNATKRFYFFLEQEPGAFDLALRRLDEDSVLITRPMAAWVLAMDDQPEWHLAARSDDGLLFERGPRAATPNSTGPDPARDAGWIRRDPIWAFCFSTLEDKPVTSLALLDRSRVDAWSEPFLNFFRAWLDRVPTDTLESFLKHPADAGNPLLRELIDLRIRPQAPLASTGSTRLERMVRVLDLIQRGDLAGARATFAALPRPMESTLYYELRDQLNPAGAPTDTAAEKWQDWGAGGPELFERLPPLLNGRLSPSTGVRTENR